MTRFLVGKRCWSPAARRGLAGPSPQRCWMQAQMWGSAGATGAKWTGRFPSSVTVRQATQRWLAQFVTFPGQMRFSLFEVVDKELSGLDVLVNNAGVGFFSATADLSIEQWQQTIDTNLSGAFYCSREALRRFRARGAGYIVNISSLAGKNPFAGGAAYNASKFGLNGFSEAMMLDHRQENVRVTYIMPGSVDTSFGRNSEPADWKIAPTLRILYLVCCECQRARW